MISEIITTEMLCNSLFQGFEMLFNICYPIMQPIIVGTVALTIIKIIVKSFVYNFELVAGSTRRQANKKAKKIVNIIDLVSNVNTVSDTLKKR